MLDTLGRDLGVLTGQSFVPFAHQIYNIRGGLFLPGNWVAMVWGPTRIGQKLRKLLS